MTPSEHSRHLLAQLGHIQHAADEARSAIADLQRSLGDESAGDVGHWVPGILEALDRIERDCVDAQNSARELRDALTGQDELQPRLL